MRIVTETLFSLSCSLQANSMKKLLEIVYDLLIEAIQLSSFVILEFGVGLVRLK